MQRPVQDILEQAGQGAGIWDTRTGIPVEQESVKHLLSVCVAICSRAHTAC